jgi:poly(3-hydroxybutyrate) depolymerase
MKMFILVLFTTVMSFAPSPVRPEKIILKEIIRSQGKERAYYLFVPDKISPATPAPLLVLLHGSGRNGMSLVEKWKDLAKKEGIIIAGPDALDSKGWIYS